MTSRKVLFAIAAIAIFGAVGTAAAASVVQAPVHAGSPMVPVFGQGVHAGQMGPEPATPSGHHHGGCGSHHWGGW